SRAGHSCPARKSGVFLTIGPNSFIKEASSDAAGSRPPRLAQLPNGTDRRALVGSHTRTAGRRAGPAPTPVVFLVNGEDRPPRVGGGVLVRQPGCAARHPRQRRRHPGTARGPLAAGWEAVGRAGRGRAVLADRRRDQAGVERPPLPPPVLG